LNVRRQSTKRQLFELNLLACIVNVNPNQVAFGIIVKNNAFGDLFTLRTCFLGEIDVQGIGLRIVIEFLGLNPLSGKAESESGKYA
jgi:hypothetical protein